MHLRSKNVLTIDRKTSVISISMVLKSFLSAKCEKVD